MTRVALLAVVLLLTACSHGQVGLASAVGPACRVEEDGQVLVWCGKVWPDGVCAPIRACPNPCEWEIRGIRIGDNVVMYGCTRPALPPSP